MKEECLFTLLDVANHALSNNNYYLVIGGHEVYFGQTLGQIRRYAVSRLNDDVHIEVRMMGNGHLILVGTVGELYGKAA